MNMFEDYMKERYAMPLEDMQKCYNMMMAEIEKDETGQYLYEKVVAQATAYANYRAQWGLWDREAKTENDPLRSACHDSLISKFDILARNLRKLGYTANWRDMLGDVEKDPVYRKRIGDFACYIVFVNSLLAR